jgi:hypothetical protein
MQSNQNRKANIERVIATMLLLVAAAISAQNLLHWAKVAEERKLGAATNDYSAVRNMYAEQASSNGPRMMSMAATNSPARENFPGR